MGYANSEDVHLVFGHFAMKSICSEDAVNI